MYKSIDNIFLITIKATLRKVWWENKNMKEGEDQFQNFEEEKLVKVFKTLKFNWCLKKKCIPFIYR
jgi:hypothetical protein